MREGSVAAVYEMSRFTAFDSAAVIRDWAKTAPLEDLKMERLRMLEQAHAFPRYRKLCQWLEDVADLRGLSLVHVTKA